MGEGRGSTLVHILVVVLCLVAFGFAIAAERRRSTVYGVATLCSILINVLYVTSIIAPGATGALATVELFFEAWKQPHANCKAVYYRPFVVCPFHGPHMWELHALGCPFVVGTWSLSLCVTLFASSLLQGAKVVDDRDNTTYCAYKSDVATGYGVGSFLFLLSSQSLLMGVTKCMCFGRPLAPGGNRAWTIIYFSSSWVTFLIAEACVIGGAAKNAYHTKYKGAAQNFSCETLRKGVFIAGAVFVVFTMILNVYYYMYFTKATSQAARKTNRANSTVGMTGYP